MQKQFDEAMHKAYLKNRGRIIIPGFRKGKAPRQIIERYYGEGIFMKTLWQRPCLLSMMKP